MCLNYEVIGISHELPNEALLIAKKFLSGSIIYKKRLFKDMAHEAHPGTRIGWVIKSPFCDNPRNNRDFGQVLGYLQKSCKNPELQKLFETIKTLEYKKN